MALATHASHVLALQICASHVVALQTYLQTLQCEALMRPLLAQPMGAPSTCMCLKSVAIAMLDIANEMHEPSNMV